ncbi:LysM domain-containing protein [Prosthecobacter fusiformis]|uniref:LysM domain-containing protein n=1 Tax=Prosthecobacter fusiformis TaxID=48464 RepID=A0A4R7RI07_9BACT|nr:LysM peptidoglycan-binding domain-containing protein [Prosthecobacter fusiformis]TDU62521.1 LysM domain-containing protein [Prosthecobacter fusiformis]
MKVPSADFFVKHPSLVLGSVFFFTSFAAAQNNYAPGAIQAPNYRHGGSAYTPARPSSPQPQPRYTTPPQSPQYQSGYGTPPNQKPSTAKGSSTTAKKSSSSNSRPVTLETKVARLEKNDARQDQRLSSIETGTGIRPPADDPHSGGKFYTVRPGDTLWRIADKHSTSINALKSANRLTGEVITVGQTLVIPGYSAAPVEYNQTGVHIVRPGDTFSQVAQANGITQDALARANPSAYPDRLLVGEKLTIPGKKASPTSYWPPADNGNPATITSRAHIVKKGESLGAIAKSYGISTSTLASANRLKNANLIEPGQRLVIPGGSVPRSPAPAPSYPPADRDTQPLPGAGLTYFTPPPAPAPAPAPEPTYQPVSKPEPPVSSNRRGIVAYQLERGDDINTVSGLFNTTPEKIRELNKLPADRKLKEGDEVVVPTIGAVSLN